MERFFAEIAARRIRRGSYSSMTWRPRSTTIWLATTRSRSRSGGPKPQRTSSRANAARSTRWVKFGATGKKCRTQNTRSSRPNHHYR
jgi:hypothetical protein